MKDLFVRPPRHAAVLSFILWAGTACGPVADLASDTERSVSADDPALVLLDSVPEIMKRANVPGLQLAFMEAGQVTMTAAFGYADTETETPVTDRTVFEAASLSKPVFAYAVLRMVDRGEWDLDEPLWDILEYDRLAHDERARELTARLALTHTTGLPNWAWGDTPLEFNSDPGERWGYSGEGIVYLQRAVEARTGLTLEEIATREVFEPLGMSDTHYVWIEAFDSLAAIPHDEFGYPADRRMPESGNAAGSLHTTATDYARFVTAVLSGEGLAPETHEAMLTPGADLTGAAWGDDEEAMTHLFWGLGWGLEQGGRGESFWHWGDQGTARCFVVAYPEDGAALVYFTNSENGLAMGPALLDLVFEDDQWALLWLDYDRYDDPGHVARLAVTHAFVEEGTEAGVAEFERVKVEHPEVLYEPDVNSLGYLLLGREAVDAAIWVFERNT
ncbi:MAG: beta-lactamase family protein, partial [Gemmatimonadetes bacterium]|nr:beta-lactamase family protein [Gemmatimonadota bacterium]